MEEMFYKLCFLLIRMFVPLNLALTTANVFWDTLTRDTFVFAKLATQEKPAKKVNVGLSITILQWYFL